MAALVEAIGTDGDDVLLCAPWRGDGHPDHEAVGRAAATAAHRTDALLLGVPRLVVALGSPGRPRRGPRRAAAAVGETAMTAKRAAVDAHESQVRPLSAAPR